MSTVKKVSLLLVFVVLCSLGATLVSAQTDVQDRQRPANGFIGSRVLVNALAELTGTAPQDILNDLERGTTLGEVIASYEIDPAAVVTQAEATITTAVNERVEAGRLTEERAATILDNLNTRLTALLAEPVPAPRLNQDNIRDRAERGLIGALVELTGQEPRDLLEQARANDYTTLAELAAANDINPADVIATANATAAVRVEEATANGNLTAEQAAQVLERLDEFFNNAIEADLSRLLAPAQRPDANAQIRRLLMQEVSAATGLEPAAIIEQLQDGTTIAAILTAYNADADAIIASITAEVNIRLEEQLQDILNNPLPAN